jgi:D-xylose transport system substrate-binding protein
VDIFIFIAMNDGTADGAVAALISQGFKPGQKIVAGGQNAEAEALRYIAQGWLDDSVLKDLRIQASDAAEVVASILDGKGVPKNFVNGKVNNQYMDVPAVFLPVTNIALDNLSDVVKAGVWTWADICKGIETTDVCKKNQ